MKTYLILSCTKSHPNKRSPSGSVCILPPGKDMPASIGNNNRFAPRPLPDKRERCCRSKNLFCAKSCRKIPRPRLLHGRRQGKKPPANGFAPRLYLCNCTGWDTVLKQVARGCPTKCCQARSLFQARRLRGLFTRRSVTETWGRFGTGAGHRSRLREQQCPDSQGRKDCEVGGEGEVFLVVFAAGFTYL